MGGADKLIPVAKQDIVVSSMSPRHIFIAVRAAPLAFDVINVHALHSGYTVEKIFAFWKEIIAIVSTYHDPEVDLVLCTDGNCRVGSVESWAIGGVAADIECASGEGLHRLLKRLRFFLPSTFEAFAKGDHHATWISSSDKLHRIDFIGIPVSSRNESVTAEVDTEIEVCFNTRAHFPCRVRASKEQRGEE